MLSRSELREKAMTIIYQISLYKKNNEVMNNIDIRLLQEKYIQTLGEDKINYISCYANIQEQILMLDDSQYEVFQRCINNYLNIMSAGEISIKFETQKEAKKPCEAKKAKT